MDPSPLTRGKLTLTHSLPLPHWLIPAHAGKTTNARPANQSPPAHPRSRGENRSSSARVSVTGGSSPLTRGKRLQGVRGRLAYRLIPAHAGKTTGSPPGSKTPAAHPPLTRGKHTIRMSRRLHAGLIPAHAGKTSFILGVLISDWAHPRSRGENHRCVHLRTVASGSSPLTRGKPRANASMSARVGLIPAHAGKTGRRRGRSQQLSAHPRSRGENLFPGLIDAGLLGSSPLTRGKPHSVPELPIRRRLIPAHAGKTAISSLYSAGLAAHPRSRGENSGGEDGHSIGFGSSPLTRGKPSIVRNPACRAGLIPAHAGKTPVRR